MDEINFLRGKLYSRAATDEYARQIVRQNLGDPCEHCGMLLGHYNYCPLLNRQAAEAVSSGLLDLTTDDIKWLREMKVSL